MMNDICKSVPSINDVHSLMAFENLIKKTPYLFIIQCKYVAPLL